MKGLDTGALLAFLTGREEARAVLDGEDPRELAVSEVTLFELEVLARSRPTLRRRRQAALERLRSRLTVLPIDARASRRAAEIVSGAKGGLDLLDALSIGALEVNGASAMLSSDPKRFAGAGLRVPVEPMRPERSKKRK